MNTSDMQMVMVMMGKRRVKQRRKGENFSFRKKKQCDALTGLLCL